MHWFSKKFKEAVATHCVGATITAVEANGTMDNEQNLTLVLDNGIRCSFNRGQGGLDGETFYEMKIGSEQSSTWDPDGFSHLTERIPFPSNTPALREGMQGMIGKQIVGPILSHQIGLLLSDDHVVLITELSGGILSAGFLLKKDGEEYTPIGKCITNFWSQCKSLYPGFLDDHLNKDDVIC